MLGIEPPAKGALSPDEVGPVGGSDSPARSAKPGESSESGAPTQPVGGRESAPPPGGGTRFEVNGKEVVTAGITKDPLLKAYKLGALVDKLEGKGKAKDLLGREFGLEHRTELTEAQGRKYVAALAALMNKHEGKK